MMEKQFHDRAEAGRLLSTKLETSLDRQDVLVLALPRGGVPVAFEVARALQAPLDILVVRKLGVPGREELAMGALASGGVRVLNHDVVQFLEIPDAVIDKVTACEQKVLERREHLYRGGHPAYEVRGRTIVLVDDGMATGATMNAAVAALRMQKPAHIIIAVPTAAPATCEEFATEVDEIVTVIRPEPFYTVGLWYENFAPTTDEKVRDLLEQARKEQSVRPQKQQRQRAPEAVGHERRARTLPSTQHSFRKEYT